MLRCEDQLADDSGKAVFTIGSITLPDKKIKSNNYQFLCVGQLVNILVHFCCDILTGSKDTVALKSDIPVLFEYMLHGFHVYSGTSRTFIKDIIYGFIPSVMNMNAN